MKILGLDIATTSGWAVIDGAEPIRTGKFRADGETDEEQFASFRSWVVQILVAERPGFVAIEAPRLMMPRAVDVDADDLAGGKRKRFASNPKTDAKLQVFNAIARMTCLERGFPFETVYDATHRKAFLGAGKRAAGTSKDLTADQCRRLGIVIKSKDAADAVSVAWWGAGRCRLALPMQGGLFQQG